MRVLDAHFREAVRALRPEPVPRQPLGTDLDLWALFRAQVKERGAAAILATHSEAAAAGCDRRYRLTAEGLRSA